VEINRDNIKEIIEKCGTKPDKDYGQNFLIEPTISEKIVEALDIQKDDKVLEVGPGLGSLTHFIEQKTSNLTVVDIDRRMTDFINVIYPNIETINNDIRKVDVNDYDLIIANLPYNITTELVQFFLEKAFKTRRMILMCQLEAFSRFNDLSGEVYGPLSIYLHLLGNSKRLFTVKAGSFYPVPKCNSVVFQIDINSHTQQERDDYLAIYKMTKQLFLARRKTINNNLSSYLNNKELCLKVLSELGIDPLTRPEQITYHKYLEMFKLIKK